MTQPQQQIQIKANDGVLKGEYANMVQVMHTGEEFVMDFLSVYPPAGSLNARVSEVRGTIWLDQIKRRTDNCTDWVQ
jgi:hypothetical protein